MLQVRSSTQENSSVLWSRVMMYIVIRPSVVLVQVVRKHDWDSVFPSVLDARCRLVPFGLPCLPSKILGHRSSLVLPYKLLLYIG